MIIPAGRDGERGFSLPEVVIAILIILVVSAIAIIQLQASLQNARVDVSLRQVLDELRQAREYAIANHRFVQITFPVVAGQDQVVITQRNDLTPGGGVINPWNITTIPIETPAQYLVVGGKPDTPDGFGNAAAIYFEGINGGPVGGMLFRSDGELVDGGTNLPINGTVFLGVPGDSTSARAITVLGTTGRIRGWRAAGAAWTQF